MQGTLSMLAVLSRSNRKPFIESQQRASLLCHGQYLIASASSAGVKVVAVTLYVVCSKLSLGAVISRQVACRQHAPRTGPGVICTSDM